MKSSEPLQPGDIAFFARGTPKGQPRPRAFAFRGRARVYDPGTAEGWKSQIAVYARDRIPKAPLSGPVRLSIRFDMPRPKSHFRKNGELKPDAPTWCCTKPDLDNMEKAVMDALTELGFFADDCLVVLKVSRKSYAEGDTGAFIIIRKIEQAA